MCKGSQTTTSSSQYTPNPQALGAYSNLISQAQGVASTPYVPYTGELVAPVNPQESAGITNVNNAAQFSLPSTLAGLNLASSASQPITSGQISQYESPYTQAVVNATQNQFNNQNAQQMAQVRGNAIAQGAMGGNREAVAEAETANQQQLAQAPVIAGLENTGYQTGLNTALTEQQAQLMGGYGVAGIGASGQNALLSGAGQQIGAGQLQQTTQQAADAAAYQQFLNQFAYPFQTTQWLGGLEGSIGPQMGGSGTGQTTGPAPSMLSQIGGLGTLLGGVFGSSGAAGALPGIMAALPFSDEKTKENIKAIGRLKDGQILYRFNYKGDPTTHIGLIAQQVEKRHPEAVYKDAAGLRHVDYDKATRDSEGVAKRDMGGGMEGPVSGYPMGVAGGVQNAPSAPYGRPGGSSYVPASNLAPAYPFSWRLPTPPSLPNGSDPSRTGAGVAALAQGIFGKMNGKGGQKNGDGGIDTSFTPSAEGDTLDIGSSPEAGSLGPIYRRGGGVHSFADGGGELGELMPPPIDLSGGQNSSVAAPPPAPSPPDFSGPIPDDISASPSADAGAGTSGVPLPRSRPPGLGVAAPPMPLESSGYGAPEPGGDYNQNDITRWQHSIGGIESGNNYTKLGPVTQSGDRAYGRYGIMGNNVPQWTQQILGKAMTPQQFLASPEAQDAVFRAKFGGYMDKYGPEGAARAWYAGEHGMNNLGATAHDANGNPIGVTVANYGQRFLKGLGLPVPDALNKAALPAGAEPTQGPAPPMGGDQNQGQGVAGGQGFLQKLFPNVDFGANSKLWPALIAAGAGMMSSRSPFPGVAIGEGATAGLNEYQYEKQAEQAGNLKQTELQQNAQKLQQAADQFALNYQVSLAKLRADQRKEQREEAKPYVIGQGPMGPIYAVPDLDSGGVRVIDPTSGQLGPLINGRTQPGDGGVPGPGGQPAIPGGNQPGRNPIGGSAPGVTLESVTNAPQPGGQAPPKAAFIPAALATPSLVDTGSGNYDDAASGLRNVMQVDLKSDPSINQTAVAALDNDQFLKNNPGYKAQILQIASGNAPLPPQTRSNNLNNYIREKAYEINPQLSAATFPMRQRALNFFAVGTQNGGGQQIIAFNRFLSHSARLLSVAEQMGLGSNVTWNELRNKLSSSGWDQTLGISDDQRQRLLGELQVDQTAVSGEGAKVLAGAHAGVTDREDWQKVFSPDTPLNVMRDKIKGVMHMGHDAMDSLAGQYNQDMGTNRGADDFLTPRSKAIMQTIEAGGNMGDTIKQLDAGKQSSLRPQDQAAVQWIKEHPNDPKVPALKQKLGLQ